MSISWENLRPLNNSQFEAFEKLCCQLAQYEKVPPNSLFIPKGDPDGGVECYWKFPNGKEWGWQAKFFRSPPTKSQWSQIDESVEKALEKHPELIKYIICLPLDRPDPRIEGRKSFMDKWDEHVEKWKGWSQEKGISLEFEYWGSHEILEHLSRKEHAGRFFFWFHEEFFNRQWFIDHVEEKISNVGPRYTPELNVDLPIADIFDSLGRTSNFYSLITNFYGKIAKSFNQIHPDRIKETLKEEFNQLEESISELLSILKEINKGDISQIGWENIAEITEKSVKILNEFISTLETISTQKTGIHTHKSNLNDELYKFRELLRNLNALHNFTDKTQAKLSNTPALLLVGKAGIGKTHLFCDIAKQRVYSGLPTILLLGNHFNNRDPWSQIIDIIDFPLKKEFLGALEAAAQIRGSRALILVDALNEGEGKYLWEKHLAGMLTTLSRYPWIGIAVSVRTSYEDMIIPGGLCPDTLIREEHFGFANHEYRATRTFFDYYGIEQPGIPLLIPEFQNPLFLKLFCDGLQNQGLTKIPRGLRGSTSIFDFFLKSVNDKLSPPQYLDFDSKSQIVQQAIKNLAEKMARSENDWLPREEAKEIINCVLPRPGHENTLFRHLLSEGVITEDRYRIDDSNWYEGIHFSYERFGDYLIAQYLLNEHLDIDNPTQSFKYENPLGKFLKDKFTCWKFRGIIEAFSIQLPEKIGKELIELIELSEENHHIREAFIESLIWRDPETITEKTKECINACIIDNYDIFTQSLNVLLTVASDPEHPYNADFLHKQLMNHSLPQRDSWWSTFLFNHYEENGAIDRLVDWAWSPEDKSHIDDESIRLCGIALTWLLTTSHRYLRDRATKALVNLFTERIHVLNQIIYKFLHVNDPYVLERLMAVAYGCAMRSINDEAIKELAQNIYKWIFRDDEPPPHILLRDYARGAIELALHREISLQIEMDKIRPPYTSEWPSEIPTEDEVEKFGRHKDMPDEEFARWRIYGSVMEGGDFARYIIGTNTYHFQWSSNRLNEPRELTKKEIYERFISSLTDRQRKAWEKYRSIISKIHFDAFRESLNELGEQNFDDIMNSKLNIAEKAEDSFIKTLGKKKLEKYEKIIIPYLDDLNRDREDQFDLSIAQRWIVKRVFDLGWTSELFDKFDRNVSLYDRGRQTSKPERIGKKYQWLAYHEFLARVSDNFEFKDELEPSSQEYDGPWQIKIRDIDPSCILKKTKRDDWDSITNTWWFSSSYDSWNSEVDDVKWLQKSDDLPCIDSFLEVKNSDGKEWFVLDANYSWKQPTPPEKERYEVPTRTIWYKIRSYIVRKPDMDELFEWAMEQDFTNGGMPEPHDAYGLFLGEFFWSPAYQHYLSENSNEKEWTRGYRKYVPKEILVTSIGYCREYGGYDCSLDDGIYINLPSGWLVQQMDLRWNGNEGHFYDKENNVVAFDPSVMTPGPGALLINRGTFLKFLNDNEYDILWVVTGRKDIIGEMMRDQWKGRLELSGAYRILDGNIYGKMNYKFIE